MKNNDELYGHDNKLYDDVYCSIGFAIIALIILGGIIAFFWFKRKFGLTI